MDKGKSTKESFLHNVNIDILQKETNLSIDEIASLVNLKNPKNVYNWGYDKENSGTRPSYNALIRLMEAGATTKTLFGVATEPSSEEIEKAVANAKDQAAAGLKKALLDAANAL